MFEPFTNHKENLANIYSIFFKVSFYKDKKKAEKNLDIMFSALNEALTISQWNRALKALAKAWEIEAPKTNDGVVDIKRMKSNLINKIIYDSKDEGQLKLMELAEQGVDDLYESF